MKTRIRKLAPDRRKELLAAAVRLAATRGYTKVSRADIAAACNVSEALVSHHFGTMLAFRRALMRHAVASGNARVVAQGLADGNPYAKRADHDLRAEIAERITHQQ